MLRRLSIGARMILPVTAVVLLLSLAAGIHIHGFASRVFVQELQLKGTAIARSLAERSAEAVLTEDWWQLHRLAQATLRSDADVSYVFVMDEHGRVVAHTFAHGFPQGLAEANSAPRGRPAQAQLLQTQEGRVRDIAVPILGGNAGTARVGISERRTESVLEKVRLQFLAVAAAVLILGVLIAAAGARLITRPIRSMAAAANAVATGDWSQQVIARGEDEVAVLGRAFNSMVAQLRDSRARLEEHAAHLEQELRERQALQQQLIQSAKLAAIGTLAAGVAHELNQPLTVIRAQVQELLETADGPVVFLGSVGGDEKAMLRDVEEQTTRMMQIIEHLRVFSRASHAKKALMSVNEAVTRALGMMGRQLRSRGIEVRLSLAPDAGEIEADAIQVEQVLLNLLTNARDALDGRAGGMIRVSTRPAAGGPAATRPGVLIELSDNGPGIPAELRDRVFEPFFTTKQVGQGTGLGLSVSHGIVTDHGGRIELATRAGPGATFRLWLPCRASSSSREEPTPSEADRSATCSQRGRP